MPTLALRYKAIIKHKTFYLQLATGILLMAASLSFNYYANNYTYTHRSNTLVSDIILDHIPNLNVEVVFLEGFLIFLGFVILVGFNKPTRIPFMLKTSALFILIRAFFITLTHLAPPLNHYVFQTHNILESLIAGSGEDLFFSGHTGFPFLMFLIFWHHSRLRTIFFIASVFFAGVVLLGHLHYSIDVFSAFFISYGIFHIATRLFKKDYKDFVAAR